MLFRIKYFAEIGLGIGISCGEMFLGNLGSKERFDYTVIGPDVNIAQRLASSGEGDRVLCTDAVLKEQKERVKRVGSKAMKLKGFVQPIMVHEIGLGLVTYQLVKLNKRTSSAEISDYSRR